MRLPAPRRRRRRAISYVAVSITLALGLVAIPAGGAAPRPVAPTQAQTASVERFLEMYEDLKDPANGYFSPEGVPYHSVETLMVEAPDHGHETTSEAFSFWIWLEAHYGQVTGDWQPFNDAWATMERYIIPSAQDQPTNSFYNPSDPATYAPELDQPSQYPTPLNFDVPTGQDPLAAELQQTYGTADIYGMHWLLDVDNVYGYGRCGDGTTRPNYINTYQRGPQESVWETVAHPSCETFEHGGPNGYLDLFIQDASYARQWRYTNAPDADARAVQAAYWANRWAAEQGQTSAVAGTVADAARMGDYLRYAFFDKYFKRISNCVGETACPGGTGRQSAHYLLSWYFGWGGALDSSGGWAWRIGSSPSHFGYQNPLAAWALANVDELQPSSPTATADWEQSLDRQLQFYQWLQSAEGAIAGGATNSWAGRYAQPPAGTPTFYGMFYDEKPVFHDPPSNQWFGFQAWSMQRVAEYLYVTGDARARTLLDNWVDWAVSETTVNADGTYRVPAEMAWSGQPDTWNPANPGSNANLHVDVVEYTDDVGTTAAYARTLMYYAAATDDTAVRDLAASLLDGLWLHRDALGVSVPEVREDYNRFDDEWSASTQTGLYIPPGFSGTMPNGDVIESGSTFLDIRSFYRDDPDWPAVQQYLDGGSAPTFRYHRFWAQADVAMAMADYARLFESDEPPPSTTTTSTSSTTTSTTSTSTTSTSTTTTMPGGTGACTVNYDVVGQWPGGFQGQVVVTNDGSSAVDGWEVTWSFADGQQITQLWGGIRTQNGAAVSVRNETWNATIPANGGSVNFGFLASWSGTNSLPTAIALNGRSCTVT